MTDVYDHPQYSCPIKRSELVSADSEIQKKVMRNWFFQHFENPVENCPHDSAEGGYQYIWGGPFNALEQLSSEFGGIVGETGIEELADELSDECVEWSAIPEPDAGDPYFLDAIRANTDAGETLSQSLSRILQLLGQELPAELRPLFERLLFVNAITTLETFLSDCFTNHVAGNSAPMRKFVETNPNFKNRKCALSEIYTRLEGLADEIRGYLSGISWHDIPRVSEMYKGTFGIAFPAGISELISAVRIRHDIVHRNGISKDGTAVHVDKNTVCELVGGVKALANHIAGEILIRESPF